MNISLQLAEAFHENVHATQSIAPGQTKRPRVKHTRTKHPTVMLQQDAKNRKTIKQRDYMADKQEEQRLRRINQATRHVHIHVRLMYK